MPSSASAPTQIYTLSLHDALPIFARELVPLLRFLARRGDQFGDDADLAAGMNVRTDGGIRRRFVADEATNGDVLLDRADRLRDFLRSEEHTSELQSHSDLVCRLLLLRPLRSTLFPYTTLFRSSRASSFPFSDFSPVAATNSVMTPILPPA